MKPGGVFVFSDIMGADGADEKALKVGGCLYELNSVDP
jgi:hypothetical protein